MDELYSEIVALNLTEKDYEELEIPDPYEFGVLVPAFIAPHAETGEDETWNWRNEDKERKWLELILRKAQKELGKK